MRHFGLKGEKWMNKIISFNKIVFLVLIFFLAIIMNNYSFASTNSQGFEIFDNAPRMTVKTNTQTYDDVVISTRARISRNLADFPFPSKMSADDKRRIQSLVYDAFSTAENWRFIDMQQISEPGKQILRQRAHFRVRN